MSLSSIWNEWHETTGKTYDGNDIDCRKAWLENVKINVSWAMQQWKDLPQFVKEILTREYHDEMHDKYREGTEQGAYDELGY